MRLLLIALGLLITTWQAYADPTSPFLQSSGGMYWWDDEPERSVKITVSAHNKSTILVEFTPAPDVYLYRNRIKFRISRPDDISVSGIELPDGELINDPTFGDTRVFSKPFSSFVNLKREPGTSNQLKLYVSYMGSTDKGVRSPVVSKTFDLEMPDITP